LGDARMWKFQLGKKVTVLHGQQPFLSQAVEHREGNEMQIYLSNKRVFQ
jgi:hypothetical protein